MPLLTTQSAGLSSNALGDQKRVSSMYPAHVTALAIIGNGVAMSHGVTRLQRRSLAEEVGLNHVDVMRFVCIGLVCLCLGAHTQEATDIYKRLLLDNRDHIAFNVYVAMCYYKLDYYDVSMEILAVYLQAHPSSAVAINLKACNLFR